MARLIKPKISSKPLAKTPASRKRAAARPKIALALAGGGPLGAMYEIGVLMALDEALDGLDLNDMDIYVGVSAGSFLTAGLANQLTPTEIYRMFIDNDERGQKQGALTPELFLKPALREYGQRLKSVPGLVIKGLVRRLASPFRRTLMESFAPLTRAIPAGVFDNEGIARFLDKAFSEPGRTNDFRKLKHKLYSVAVDLDTGKAVAFGGPGYDHVPIAKAVQASAALPGLFPPVPTAGQVLTATSGTLATWQTPVTSIIVKEEGTNITNTPHTSLNFIGPGITATDGGAGVANVTIIGGYTNATVTTANGTATTIATIATVTTTYLVDAKFAARRTDVAGTSAGYIYSSTFRNVAGVLTKIAQTKDSHEDVAGWDVNAAVSGTNIILTVTGAIGSTINWKVNYSVMTV